MVVATLKLAVVLALVLGGLAFIGATIYTATMPQPWVSHQDSCFEKQLSNPRINC